MLVHAVAVRDLVRAGAGARAHDALTRRARSMNPVRGPYIWCQGCGHGGHVACIKMWFTRERVCAAGCGHVCDFACGQGGAGDGACPDEVVLEEAAW